MRDLRQLRETRNPGYTTKHLVVDSPLCGTPRFPVVVVRLRHENEFRLAAEETTQEGFTLDAAKKLEVLQVQIDEAKSGHPADFDLWRNRTEMVLRTTLGADHPQVAAFQKNRYSPQVWYSGMDSSGYRPAGVKRAIAMLETAKAEVALLAEVSGTASGSAPSALGEQVFIVHGRNEAVKLDASRTVEALLGAKPTILHQQPNKGRVLIEKFEQVAADCGFAIILLTADDHGGLQGGEKLAARARQNVVLEMGYFFGKLGRSRVIALLEDGVERPSDIEGIIYIDLDRAGAWRTKLATELEAAGYEVGWKKLGSL